MNANTIPLTQPPASSPLASVPAAPPRAASPVAGTPPSLRLAALQQFYASLTAPVFEPGASSWNHVTNEDRAAWSHHKDAASRLTVEIVVDQARASLAFHQTKEIETAAEIDRIREGRSGHAEWARPTMIDKTTKLLAHHRNEIVRISAGIDRLAGEQIQQAAE